MKERQSERDREEISIACTCVRARACICERNMGVRIDDTYRSVSVCESVISLLKKIK